MGTTWIALELAEGVSLPQYHGFSLPTQQVYAPLKTGGFDSHPVLLLIENDQVIIPTWSMALYLMWKADQDFVSDNFPNRFTSHPAEALLLANVGEGMGLWKIRKDPETWCRESIE